MLLMASDLLGVMSIFWMHEHYDSLSVLRAEVLVTLHPYAMAQTGDELISRHSFSSSCIGLRDVVSYF